MKIKCELAPYKKSAYEDHDRGVIATILFPLLDQYIADGKIQMFSLDTFVDKLKEGSLSLQVGASTYHAVRLHGFELNQPMRLAFPETGPPLVLLVLQVYMPITEINTLHNKPLYIII